MAFRSNHRSWILALLVAGNVAACAALEAADGTLGTGGAGAGGSGGNGGSGGVIDYDASTGSGATGGYAMLCGRGSCDVAATMAVTTCDPGDETGGAGGGGGGSGTAAGTGGAGTGGASSGSGGAGSGASTGGAGTGGAGAGTGGAGTGGAETGGAGGSDPAGTGGAGTGGIGTGGTGGYIPPETTVECKLIVSDGAVQRGCVASGDYPELSPCNTAADCGPGLGCVLAADQSTGVCRSYCCGDIEACAAHTYCAPQAMTEAADPNVQIPVCIDADDCTLLEEGQCGAGLVCAVVRADGTTACVPPGPGKQGETCPCALGFTCSKLVDECREICHTDPDKAALECDTGYKCQGNSSLPDGFGVCISTNEL